MNEMIRPLPQEEALRRLREKLAEHVPKDKLQERDGPSNTKIKFVTDDYILTKLDEIFGPLNWDRKVLQENIAAEFTGAPKRRKQKNWTTKQDEWVDYVPECIVASARCQITVRYANQVAVYEDVGAIVREVDLKDKPAAYMIAIKGAATDGYKRCAAQIGNIFGRGLLQDGQQKNNPDYSDAVFVEAHVYVMDANATDANVIDGEVVPPQAPPLPLQAPKAAAPFPAAPAPIQAKPAAAEVAKASAPASAATPAATNTPEAAVRTAPAAQTPVAAPAAPAASAPATAKPATSAPAAPAAPASTGTFAPGAKFAAKPDAPAADTPAGQSAAKTLDDLRAMYNEMKEAPLSWTSDQWKEFAVAFSQVIANAEPKDIDPITKALALTQDIIQKSNIGATVKDIATWFASNADRLKRRRISFGMN